MKDDSLKNSILELYKVWHWFGSSVALQDLSLTIEESEVVCLLGPSGCGKSTALRIAAGLEKAQKGIVRVGGEVASTADFHIPAEDRNVGLVFQDYALFPHLSVIDNVKFGLGKGGFSNSTEMATNALEMVNMGGFSSKFPHTLSGGEQQRVALARALAPRPQVMLLDEPYSGLDARLRENIRDEVLHLLRKEGCATLMVTHDSEEAMFMADRIIVMERGRIVQAGTPEELYFNPINSFVAGIFGELNKFNGRVELNNISSELADFPLNGMEKGQSVEIVIRPEALEISSMEPGAPSFKARVIESRLLGRMSYIHLSSFSSSMTEVVDDIHVHCKMPGRVLPNPGEIVDVNIDLAQAFIFKKELFD